jgi:lipoprotein signal peptidase
MLLELGAGFLAGGAIGNAIDRVLFNQVTDFIIFGTSNGILNLADYALNVGIVLLLLDTVNKELMIKRGNLGINKKIDTKEEFD